MAFRFKDTELPLKRRLRDSLSTIYGIGYQRASYLCDLLGFGNSLNISYINRYDFENFSTLMKYDYILDERLKNLIKQRIEFFLGIRLTKGLRLFKGLPVRGQRTHTNSKNPKKLKPILSKKLELMFNIVKKPEISIKQSKTSKQTKLSKQTKKKK